MSQKGVVDAQVGRGTVTVSTIVGVDLNQKKLTLLLKKKGVTLTSLKKSGAAS